ncbi:hypothetical protein [Bacillus sp. FJAT-52991]|uniref:PIN domain-containing protein n=1 Tax=Bacillus kandeliae TaxID=3129297 RepID=A0ABZ2NBE4_9BACI
MKRSGKVFIDANMIIHAAVYHLIGMNGTAFVGLTLISALLPHFNE